MYDFFQAVTAGLSDEELVSSSLQGLISAQIVIRRRKLGLSQKEFADLMGVSQSLVSRWENGDTNYTISTLAAIAAKLDIPVQCPFIPALPEADVSVSGNTYVVCANTAWTANTITASAPVRFVSVRSE